MVALVKALGTVKEARRAAAARQLETAPERRPVARIYRPAQSAMQSGRANRRRWILEFEPQAPLLIEPLMGWTASTDPWRQVRLAFPDRESAIGFAERQGYAYSVSEPQRRRRSPGAGQAPARNRGLASSTPACPRATGERSSFRTSAPVNDQQPPWRIPRQAA